MMNCNKFLIIFMISDVYCTDLSFSLFLLEMKLASIYKSHGEVDKFIFHAMYMSREILSGDKNRRA